MRLLFPLLFFVLPLTGQQQADIYTAKELHALGQKPLAKGQEYSARELSRYGNHYFLMVRRDSTGSSELHQHEADVFVVESGHATIILGGKLAGEHVTKPGEIRGKSIIGGTRHQLSAGDVIHIPAGTPHQLLIEKSEPFTYFVVKVSGQ